jgi:Tfp pilus assembly major pilin PilA
MELRKEAVSTQDMEALYSAAVGAKRADFYVPKFIRFDQVGASTLSWNWPAFFVAFYWFLYRRMYSAWAIYSIAIPIAIGILSGIIEGAMGADSGNLFYTVVSLVYYFGFIPTRANALYHRSVRKRIEALREKVPETPSQLLILDNNSPTSAIVWVIAPMVVIAMIGILAAIAIPAYQSYTIRAQVTEGFAIADELKPKIASRYQSNKSWPANLADLGVPQPSLGRYVEKITLDHGTISVEYSKQAQALIAGHQLSFRPLVIDASNIAWTCGYWVRPDGADDGIGPNLTDIKPEFLPSACRK